MIKTIGIISRIEKDKGHDVLIDAFNLLRKRTRSVRLMIVGAGDDREIRRKIARLKLEKSVWLMGFQEDVAPFYRQFDVFVFPTHWALEGFGLVVLEAMNAGVPVISTNFGPIPEIAGDAAILVPPKDPAALADAIYKVLNDPKLSKKLILKGRKRAKEYDIRKISKIYIENILETIKAND